MPIDTNSHEFLLLLRQFEKGQVVLFTGAGFSIGARNSRGSEPPDATALARQLAVECGWSYTAQTLATEQGRWVDLNSRLDELERLLTPAR